MIQNPANINILWAELLIGELVRNGVTMFCISPGSRSAPLTVAAAADKNVETIVGLDERGAGFYALGYARATNRPAALICTSGTAAANYYPAVIEAHQSRLPMIILSADRPPELRDTGANQTINQIGLFGSYTGWTTDLPAPDATLNPRFILTTADQAFYQATRHPAGPVQINCMFREPLEPKPVPYPGDYLDDLTKWQEDQQPWTAYPPSQNTPAEKELREIARRLDSDPKTLLVAGRTGVPGAIDAIGDLARHTGWPVFADVSSGMQVSDDQIQRINWYDLLLASERVKDLLSGYRILHIGDPLTSKRFQQFVTANPPGEYIHIHSHARRQDPAHLITMRVVADIPVFCAGLKPLLNRHDPGANISAVDRLAGKVVGDFLTQEDRLSEIWLAAQTAGLVPADQGLFLGSSMPVRDFDMFGRIRNPNVRVAANRGASGIDGSISSAAGFARGLKAPVTAVIGDLAFLHDLNALDLVRKTPHRIILIVINNNGGGIFSFLPIAGFDPVFEKYFATPHNLTFDLAAKMFGIRYTLAHSRQEFIKAYRSALNQKLPLIIEVNSDRDENYQLHRKLLDRVAAAADNQLV